jgi:hypothetical protein
MDPDPHLLKKLDPDPHKVNADPKHITHIRVTLVQNVKKVKNRPTLL